MNKPIIVTGCGRSGTHWLGNIMQEVLGADNAAWEPFDHKSVAQVVVDSRLRADIDQIRSDGHEIVHLVRDGRDVARSLYQWYTGNQCVRTNSDGTITNTLQGELVPFSECCLEWRDAIDIMGDHRVLRIEDLSTARVKDSQPSFTVPHWTQWNEETTDRYWKLCGSQMRRMGYTR